MSQTGEPEPRWLEAITLFNAGEYFACHDILEEIWSEADELERQFYQGLIHVAVSLHHFEGGNFSGARKMHDSALKYLAPYGDVHNGLNLTSFHEQYHRCFVPLLKPWSEYPSGICFSVHDAPQWALMTE